MMFYTDYGYEIALDLDGKAFTTFVAGQLEASSNLWIDRDANKKRSYKLETVFVGKPFNYTGTTYVLAGGPDFRVLATNEIDEQTWSTPAVANGALFFRTALRLFCIAAN